MRPVPQEPFAADSHPSHEPSRRDVLRGLGGLAALGLTGTLPGCWGGTNEAVLYCALDSEFARPLLEEFSRKENIAVLPKFDVEASKTVGLAQALLAERDRPRADVFWNNEVLHTLRLDRAGLLEPQPEPIGGDLPAWARSPRRTWFGFAARARVLLVHLERLPPAERPSSVRDLADARFRGRCGLAKPLFGTTATHAACLFATWGTAAAEAFFEQADANGAQILPGNKQVAQAVGTGALDWGLTDTDDALAEIAAGKPVGIVWPDQVEGQPGTLFIPNTIAQIRGGPHPAAGRKLLEYVLSPAVETALAAGPSGQIPVREKLVGPPGLADASRVRRMEVDFEQAADVWDAVAKYFKNA